MKARFLVKDIRNRGEKGPGPLVCERASASQVSTGPTICQLADKSRLLPGTQTLGVRMPNI